MMSFFNPATLLMSLLISSVGVVLFVYGRKQSRVPHLIVGIVLVLYTFFVSNVFLMAFIGIVLIALLFGAVKLGW